MGVFVEVATTGTQQEGKLYVGNTGVAIQNAVNYVKSQGGGSVFINNGIYDITDAILIDSSNIELHGEGYHTKLKNNATTHVIHCKGISSARLYGIHIHDLYIGNTDSGTARIGKTAIYAEYVGDDNRGGLKIEYVHFIRNGNAGIKTNYCSNVVVTENAFHRNYLGTEHENGTWTNITDNQFVSSAYLGTIYARSVNTMIDGNIVSMSSGHAVTVGKEGSMITGNVFNGSEASAIYTYNNDMSIYGNTVYNNTYSGMSLTYTTNDSSVIANTVTCNYEFGLDFGTVENSVFISNNIYKNTKGGITIWSTSKNDVFLGNRYQSYTTGGTGHVNQYNITS